MLDCKGTRISSRLDFRFSLRSASVHSPDPRWPPPPPISPTHRRALAGTTLAELFARDPDRFARLSFAWDDWLVDLSKERLGPDTLPLLVAEADAAGLPGWIRGALRRGEGQPVRAQAGAAHGAAPDGRCAARRGRPRHHSRHSRGAVADAHARRPDPRRAARRRGGTTDPRRRQPRHRRVGSRRVPRLLGAGARAARAGQHRPADARRRRVVRVQRRSRAHHPCARAARPGDHALRHHVEIVHHRRRRSPMRRAPDRGCRPRSARAST